MRDGYLLPVVGGSENMDVNVASVVKSKTQKMKVEELKKIVEKYLIIGDDNEIYLREPDDFKLIVE
jgi:hypothetical protein